jgi:hypothetical protein
MPTPPFSVPRFLATVIILLTFLTCIFGPAFLSEATVPLTDHPVVSIAGEPYITSTYVIKDGLTFKMWYTHLKTTLNLIDLATSLGSLLTQSIIDDITDNNLNSLLNDMATLNAEDLFSVLNSLSTVIGYATSTDGIAWNVATDNHTVLAGNNGGAWNPVGNLCVIKDGSSYKMWYTGNKSNLSKSALQGILTGLAGSAAIRKTAIMNLLAGTTTAIYYATSNDGITWTPNGPAVLTSSTGLWDSASSPSVIKDGATYKMWYTRGLTSLTGSDLDTILADPTHFGIDNLIQEFQFKTGKAIGYATSPDGINWTTIYQSVIAGTGSAWDSVETPSVLKTGNSFEMWYSRMQTDLTSSGIHAMLQDSLALAPTISSLMTTLASGKYDQFLTDLSDVIDNGMAAFKADLAHTSSAITYATSTDGIAWVIQDSQFFAGSALWNSVGSPCVISDNGVYKMWYMKGVSQLTAQNVVDYLQGTSSPVGYATGFNLVAETGATVIKDTDGAIAILLSINRAKDSYDNSTQSIPGGIASYQAQLSYDPTGIQVMSVRAGTVPFGDTPTFDPATGLLSGTATTPLAPNNSPVVKVLIRLIGNATTSYTLTISFRHIMSASSIGMDVPPVGSQTFTFRRGDANGDGIVNIVDAMFIAQYVTGNRTLSALNPVNSASVRYDGSGDTISIVDAMFVAQYVTHNRNTSFQ